MSGAFVHTETMEPARFFAVAYPAYRADIVWWTTGWDGRWTAAPVPTGGTGRKRTV